MTCPCWCQPCTGIFAADLETCGTTSIEGIVGTNDIGSVCCPHGCMQCGEEGCGRSGAAEGLHSTDCCINGVLNNQDLCSVKGEAPCILDGEEDVAKTTRICSSSQDRRSDTTLFLFVATTLRSSAPLRLLVSLGRSNPLNWCKATRASSSVMNDGSPGPRLISRDSQTTYLTPKGLPSLYPPFVVSSKHVMPLDPSALSTHRRPF